ncbi:hypothetical protein BU24DRAFT_165321 [Aaosphaeria arxii CBS 175.79]|uniref:Uncharacterized protein n=1 Tax=Aaosphaeria arxii CBS 175.79 TaxID=1450172 RepID=A0A6A5XZ14_9PLEO|nr:uncharacterized protein BU24DRAFT_165321 [Aaosphaeria arxii CBS 175.79]KAF2018133.1 hypothetical protein BU24DRAFT_165321 [Aaosphaeria arxii CBS 175.79]
MYEQFDRRTAFMNDGNWAPQNANPSGPGALFTRIKVDRSSRSSIISIKNGSAMSSCSSLRSEPRSILVRSEKGRTSRILPKKLKRLSAPPPGPTKRVSFIDAVEESDEESEGETTEKDKKRTSRFSISGMPTAVRSMSSPYPKTKFHPATFVEEEDEDEDEDEESSDKFHALPIVRVPTRASSSNSAAARLPTGAPSSLTVSSTPGTCTPASNQSSASSSSSSLYSTPASSIRSSSPSLDLESYSINPKSPAPSTPHNPLLQYLPCTHPMCTSHYLPSSLGPTFHTQQAPYNLRRKRGLCAEHATSDLALANIECKDEWETMRQNAGRRTLGEVAADFKQFTRDFDQDRERESRDSERLQRLCVVGRPPKQGTSAPPTNSKRFSKIRDVNDDAQSEWWRYAARPCAKKDCEAEWYAPFSKALYDFYFPAKRNSNAGGLTPLTTLCPSCAAENVEVAEREIQAKREELDDEECILWMEKLRKDRGVEVKFWERAQEKFVREQGVRWRDEIVGKDLLVAHQQVLVAAAVVVTENQTSATVATDKTNKKLKKKLKKGKKGFCVVM